MDFLPSDSILEFQQLFIRSWQSPPPVKEISLQTYLKVTKGFSHRIKLSLSHLS